jgi:hypothetical protein
VYLNWSVSCDCTQEGSQILLRPDNLLNKEKQKEATERGKRQTSKEEQQQLRKK